MKTHSPRAAVLVIRDGTPALIRIYGFADPDDQMTVLLLTNRRSLAVMSLAERVAQLYLP